MSEEKKTPVKNAQPGKAAKILNWFKTLPQRIAKPFKSMYYELKKVTWPTKQRLVSYSIIVLVFMLFMSVVIGLLDMGASAGVRSLISATSGSTAVPGKPRKPWKKLPRLQKKLWRKPPGPQRKPRKGLQKPPRTLLRGNKHGRNEQGALLVCDPYLFGL